MRRFNCKTRWQLPEGIVLNFINRLANFKPLTRTKGLKDISPINMYASRLIWDNPASKWITWSYPTTLQVDHFKSHRFLKMSQLSAFAVNRCRTHLQCSDKLWASEVQKLREANMSLIWALLQVITILILVWTDRVASWNVESKWMVWRLARGG